LRKNISTGFVVFAGLLGAPLPQPGAQAPGHSQDPRLARLSLYLTRLKSPVTYLAPEFIAAADRNTLDWRLLPSIAVIESGAGKEYVNNNIFGWDSGKQKFPSIRASIHSVAHRLSRSKLYRNKDVEDILGTYNPNPGYPGRVMRVMKAIGPEERFVRN